MRTSNLIFSVPTLFCISFHFVLGLLTATAVARPFYLTRFFFSCACVLVHERHTRMNFHFQLISDDEAESWVKL